MADLASTRVFGKLTVMHEAIVKANAEIVGDITASKFIGNGSGLTDLNASNISSGTISTSRLPAAALIGNTTYSAGTGLSLSGTTFSVTNPFNPSGSYTGLRARATTAADVGAPPTSRTITAGTGLSGGGNLTANRTLSVNYGTAAGTAAQGNDSRIVNAVPNSRQIISGTGLSGGGTLAANRTLSVKYGTAAGTAAQGNDSRLSNSREWTATTVSQAEAEAGTATTRRAWTAQRVRQAIEAHTEVIDGGTF